jgi:hypothetical protein
VLNIIVGAVNTHGPEATKQLPENFLSKLKLQLFKSFLQSVKRSILGKSFLNKLSGGVNKLAATQILVDVNRQSWDVTDRARKLQLTKLFKVDALDAFFFFLHSPSVRVTQDRGPVGRRRDLVSLG